MEILLKSFLKDSFRVVKVILIFILLFVLCNYGLSIEKGISFNKTLDYTIPYVYIIMPILWIGLMYLFGKHLLMFVKLKQD